LWAAAAKSVVTIWAESSGRMRQFEYKLSLGDGSQGLDHRYNGYTMMAPGRLLRMGVTATNVRGFAVDDKTTIAVLVNGEAQRDYQVSTSENERSAYTIFDTPLEVEAGSAINFMTARIDAAASATIVSLLIELDL
jgi:hypothetical protein